jgi:uroporphyrinogen decarboxylase
MFNSLRESQGLITPKEIVTRAIEFGGPPRVPINYCNRDFEFSDTAGVGYAPAASFAPAVPEMTEWGYVWRRLDATMGQPGARPLSDPSKIADYEPPDPFAPGRLEHVAAALAEQRHKFLKFGLGITGFNQATFLRGFEDFLVDLHAAPERAERVLDFVFDFENGVIGQLTRVEVDAVSFGDDWGTQRGLIIAPDVWRRVFRPRYAEQFARVHVAGKKVWFHTCGNVWEIIGDMIDIGVDVLELLQPDIFGVERLADTFGGKVCFCCSVDHQRRAISGTREEIFASARLLRDRLGAFNGGFIAYIEDYTSLGMDEQHYQWIRQAFHGLNDPTRNSQPA